MLWIFGQGRHHTCLAWVLVQILSAIAFYISVSAEVYNGSAIAGSRRLNSCRGQVIKLALRLNLIRRLDCDQPLPGRDGLRTNSAWSMRSHMAFNKARIVNKWWRNFYTLLIDHGYDWWPLFHFVYILVTAWRLTRLWPSVLSLKDYLLLIFNLLDRVTNWWDLALTFGGVFVRSEATTGCILNLPNSILLLRWELIITGWNDNLGSLLLISLLVDWDGAFATISTINRLTLRVNTLCRGWCTSPRSRVADECRLNRSIVCNHSHLRLSNPSVAILCMHCVWQITGERWVLIADRATVC